MKFLVAVTVCVFSFASLQGQIDDGDMLDLVELEFFGEDAVEYLKTNPWTKDLEMTNFLLHKLFNIYPYDLYKIRKNSSLIIKFEQNDKYAIYESEEKFLFIFINKGDLMIHLMRL